MKDFVREHPLFSLCGLNCALCPMQLGGHCPGCGGGEGQRAFFSALSALRLAWKGLLGFI